MGDGRRSALMNIDMSERGDVSMLDDVIEAYAQHHKC